jgi:disulfide oxidoreductase YuzD
MSDTNPEDIAKSYVDEHFPNMSDGNYYVIAHNPQHDMHLVDHLDGVDASHLDENLYHVVTVSKNIKLDGDITVPHTIKIKVKDGQVSSVLTSKSFDASAV